VLDTYKDKHARKLTLDVVIKILMWCVNEILTLKGQPTKNAAQFRSFVKDLM
jgi:hypothetical protein